MIGKVVNNISGVIELVENSPSRQPKKSKQSKKLRLSHYIRGTWHGIGITCLLVSILLANIQYKDYKEVYEVLKPAILENVSSEGFGKALKIHETLPILYPTVTDVAIIIYMADGITPIIQLKGTELRNEENGTTDSGSESGNIYKDAVTKNNEVIAKVSKHHNIPNIALMVSTFEAINELNLDNKEIVSEIIDSNTNKLNQNIKLNVILTLINAEGFIYAMNILIYWVLFKPLESLVIKPLIKKRLEDREGETSE